MRDARRTGRAAGPSIAVVAALGAAALAGVLAPAALLPSSPAAADTDDFEFASFDADYYLDRTTDGSATMTIVETLVAQFPDIDQNRGIVRAIPDEYDEYPLSVDVRSVTDEEGNAVPYSRSSENGFTLLALGTDEFVHGRQTYVLEYTVDDPIRAFEDTGADELYWDTNGTGWAQPFAQVTARFHVPADLAEALTGAVACYRGSSGSPESCALERQETGTGTVFTATETGLSAGENVTVAIAFHSGTFSPPVRPRDAWWATLLPHGLLAAIAAAALTMIVIRRTRWRDARGRGVIIPQYSPPEADLLLAGNIVGRSGNAMAALFVDLAVRRMVQLEDRGTGVPAPERYALRLRDPAGATEDEAKVLRVLFGKELEPGKGRVLGKLSAHGKALLAGLADPKDRAKEAGLRATTSATTGVRLRRLAGWLALALTVLGVVAVLAGALHPLLVFEILAGWVLWVVTAAFSSRRDALTPAGAELRDHLLGMRDYLALAEEERFRMLQSPVGALRVDGPGEDDVVRLYERLLPYAILWNVEDQWVEVLRARYADTGADNEWLVSRSPLASLDLHGFSASTSAATHPPSTSSGSSSYSGSGSSSSFGGSSGGGFSGGGGGGGGGGGR